MKTAILQLESHDDLISIREKISWTKSERIVLVQPAKTKHSYPVLDLRLIQRAAAANGAKIALVTRNPRTIENAEEACVPVFSSIPRAERGDWEKLHNTAEKVNLHRDGNVNFVKREGFFTSLQPRQLSSTIRITIFLFAILALVSLAVYIFPSAVVKLYPVTRLQNTSVFDVMVLPSTSTNNVIGSIPAVSRTISKSLEKTATSSGTVIFPEGKATGKCDLKNLTNESLILPAGIVFSTSDTPPIRFISLEQIDLPTGKRSVSVKVEALLPGREGNVEIGKINQLEGVLGAKVEVSNPETFSGGSSIEVPSPTVEDYEKLRIDIIRALFLLATATAESQQSLAEKVIPESLEIEKVISDVMVNPIGEPSDSLKLAMTIQYKVLYFNPDDVSRLGKQFLNASLESGIHPLTDEVSIEYLNGVMVSGSDSFRWRCRATRPVAQNWEVNELVTLIKGLPEQKAIEIINSKVPHVKTAEIKTKPNFWPLIPFLTSQVSVEEISIP